MSKSYQDYKQYLGLLKDVPSSNPREWTQPLMDYFEELSELGNLPEKYRNKAKEFAHAFRTIDAMQGDEAPSEEEYNKAVQTLGGMQDFLIAEVDGETVDQMLTRAHKSDYMTRHKGILDPEAAYDGDYGGVHLNMTNLYRILDVELDTDVVQEKGEELLSTYRKQVEQARKQNKLLPADFPASGAQVGAYLLQDEGKFTNQLNTFSNKLRKKVDELDNAADERQKLKYEGLEKLNIAAANLGSGPISRSYNGVNAKAVRDSAADGADFMLALEDFREKSPAAYKELCGEFEEQLKATDFSKGKQLLDQHGVNEQAYGRKSAYHWLEDYKSPQGQAEAKLDLEDYFAKIMAVRTRTNAKPNSPSTLSEKMTGAEIKETAKQIKETKGFQAFMQKLDRNADAKKAAMKAAATGHGGGVEKQFREFLKTQRAGDLENEEPLARYMPTARERIEFLQQEAKEKLSRKAAVYDEAAEILAIRNMVKAERYQKKSLNGKIPAQGVNLKEETEKINTQAFHRMMDDPDLKASITEGHGGEMVDKLRSAASKPLATEPEENLKKALNANTVRGRIETLHGEALVLGQKLKDRLDKPLDEVTRQLLKSASQISAEYLALVYQRNRAPQKKMGENIPWAEVNKNAGQVRESPLSKQVFSEKNLSGAVKEMEHLHKDRERMGEYVERWGNLMQPRIREDGPEPEKKEENIRDPENEMKNPAI